MVADAERYRWLRDESPKHKCASPSATMPDGFGIKVRMGFHGDYKCQPYMDLSGYALDQAIDSAKGK